MKLNILILSLLFVSNSVLAATQMASDRISDIRNTKHNFATNDEPLLPNGDTRDVKALNTNEVCVFCHTPHGSPNVAIDERPFLWNRATSDDGFTRYTSSSLDLTQGVLGQGSKMCLSCHDGSIAIGQLDVINGRLGQDISSDGVVDNMTGNNVTGGHLTSGNSFLGKDLSNDHPVGFPYNSALVSDDGELIDPSAGEGAHIGVPVGRGLAQNNFVVDTTTNDTANASQPTTTTTDDLSSGAISTGISVPLESVVSGLDNRDSEGNLVRSLVSAADTGSVECTTCHDPHIRSRDNAVNIKFLRLHRFQDGAITEGSFSINGDINCLACHKKAGWASSAHATDPADEDYVYEDTAASEREFPQGIEMWQASCLNCHDTHTDNGARWLLRKATDGAGNSEIENTCFQCHTNNNSILQAASPATDIESVNLTGGKHTASDFDSNTNLHNITNANFQESQANLQANRHVTCSDCHNPHRVVKNTLADGTGNSDSALHVHPRDGSSVAHSNLISGALSGISGVEPMFDMEVAGFNPHSTNSNITFNEKFGAAGETDAVTKEYQICMKCHSNWGLDETTDIGTLVENKKANIAGELGSNAVSYHPIVRDTDSNTSVDKANKLETATENYLAPFDAAVGTQTMYCSDCHDSNAADSQGPHGTSSLLNAAGDNLCIECHDPIQYQTGAGTAQDSGFSCANATDCAQPDTDGNANNLHVFHASSNGNVLKNGPDNVAGSRTINVCTDCHVKIPHGWQNKALLVDENDAAVTGDATADAISAGLKARYYPNGFITITRDGSDNMPASGQWVKASCGTADGCHNP